MTLTDIRVWLYSSLDTLKISHQNNIIFSFYVHNDILQRIPKVDVYHVLLIYLLMIQTHDYQSTLLCYGIVPIHRIGILKNISSKFILQDLPI